MRVHTRIAYRCDACHKHNYLIIIHMKCYIPFGAHGHSLNGDIIGSVPKALHGVYFLLVVIENFTKYHEVMLLSP